MKLYAIATIVTASTVSFFQTTKPTVDSNPGSVEALVETAQPAQANPNWDVIPGEESPLDLYQADGESFFDDPLETNSEGGFAAGGVVEVVEPSGEWSPVVDLDDPNSQVIDSIGTVGVDSANSVSEVANVAPVEDLLAEVEEVIATTEASGRDSLEESSIAAGFEVFETEAVMVGVDPGGIASTEGDQSPDGDLTVSSEFPEMASSAVEEAGEPIGGIADRLVDRVTEAVTGQPSEEEMVSNEPTMGEEDGGFWLRAARLNDVFQYLARLGNVQYFHNADLDAANFVVTGHLGDGDPIEQMEELGLMYGVTVHQKGHTVYAMTSSQLAQLPTKPFYYQLRYLRGTDIEQIKGILGPVLTPGSGSVDFEQKTNTLIFIDNEQRIESIREILAELDKPKKQIAIETRILRVRSSSRNRIGVDWESVLGDGLTIEGTEALNTLFNLPDSDMVEQVITTTLSGEATSPFTVTDVNTARERTNYGNITGMNDLNYNDETTRTINSTESQLVLDPLQLQATIRALNTGGLAQQESSPTLITEDNEAGIISIIDRVPIITATVSETTAGQNITEEVRYLIDENDPSFSDDPAANREIGVTVAVTPTILPDGTIRMALRPRAAQVVEWIKGNSNNLYPRVNESTIDTIARLPNGHSLLIGGFYEEQESDETKKVPVLGDVPGLNFFFKTTDTIKEHTSLVFVVTPKLYEPVSMMDTDRINREIQENSVLPNDHAWPDRRSPGDNYEPNLGWTLGNAINAYPPTPPTSPLHPEHPVNMPEWDVNDEPGLRNGQTMVETGGVYTDDQPRRKGGLFGKLFKKRQ